MARRKRKIDIRLLKRHNIHIEPLPPTGPEEKRDKARVYVNYDLELDDATKGWLLHLDLGCRIPGLVYLIGRTSFRLPCKEKEVFQDALIQELIKHGWNTCKVVYEQQGPPHQVKTDWKWQDLQEKPLAELAKAILDQHAKRSRQNKLPEYMIQHNFTIGYGGNTRVTIMGTFAVLDVLFYVSKSTDVKRNRQVFYKHIPESTYTTTKLRCIEIQDEKTVRLDMRQHVVFMRCMECACWLVTSDFFSYLEEDLRKRGFSEEYQEVFLQHAKNLRSSITKNMAEKKVRITNLEEEVDWAKLFQEALNAEE